MIKGKPRELCIDALKRKGMVQRMTVKEKYEKAFKQLTLTPEQINYDLHQRRASLRMAKQFSVDPQGEPSVIEDPSPYVKVTSLGSSLRSQGGGPQNQDMDTHPDEPYTAGSPKMLSQESLDGGLSIGMVPVPPGARPPTEPMSIQDPLSKPNLHSSQPCIESSQTKDANTH